MSERQQDKKKKETILDLGKYLDKKIRVKFSGGREVSGVLKGDFLKTPKKNGSFTFDHKGFDPLLNIVLDSTIEYMRDIDDPYKMTNETRALGLVVCRGTSVILISPQDGMEEIQNPFATA